MLTDGRAAATGAFAPPTEILPSIPAWRWPGTEQKYANSPALSARNTVTLLAPLRFTRSVDTLKSGNTTSCSMPSPLMSPICTMSPRATRSAGFTTPSMSPPTPTNASLPSASSVLSRKRTVGVYSAAGLFFETFGAEGVAGAGRLVCAR
jgi:hypothetical protein